MDDFETRMFIASEEVYAAIEAGEIPAGEVEAALLDAQLKASTPA